MTALPNFSVVVPRYAQAWRNLAAAYDSRGNIQAAIGAWQTYTALRPKDVDGLNNLSVDVTVITQPHAGPATARNTGAARARGDYLAFTDDDCQAEPDWLGELAARLEGARDLAVGGRTVNALAENPYASATQLLVDYLSEWTRASGQGAFFASNNLAVPTELFRRHGGFDTAGHAWAGGSPMRRGR